MNRCRSSFIIKHFEHMLLPMTRNQFHHTIFSVFFLLSSIILYVNTNDAKVSSRQLNVSDEARSSRIHGTKVLASIPNYDIENFIHVQETVGSFRDLCEGGAIISLIIYSTFPYSIEMLHSLNALTQCRHPGGILDISIKVKSPAHGLNFVDFHRQYFYDHVNEFDLFIYAEDDMHVRPR